MRMYRIVKKKEIPGEGISLSLGGFEGEEADPFPRFDEKEDPFTISNACEGVIEFSNRCHFAMVHSHDHISRLEASFSSQ